MAMTRIRERIKTKNAISEKISKGERSSTKAMTSAQPGEEAVDHGDIPNGTAPSSRARTSGAAPGHL
jgi:hypothetical protein